MDGSGDLSVLLLLFVGLFLDWIIVIVSVVIAVVIRPAAASALLAIVLGALLGLVGSRLELLDIYLTRDGWASIDALALITVVLATLASFAWWLIARVACAIVRRIFRPATPP